MQLKACVLVALTACSRATAPSVDAAASAAPRASDASASNASVPNASAADAGTLAAKLVDIAGFTATPVETQPEFVRRIYSRNSARITVTLGRGARIGLDEWKRTTLKYGYPIAPLGVPDTDAFGFFDCDDGGVHCDLHAHTARGLHIEVQSGGTATRADLEALVAGLPMRALASE